MCKYHLLKGILKRYNNRSFSDLLKEQQKYDGYIFWSIGTKKKKHAVEKGDICYIYYSDLPDGSSRILFRGKVEDSDYPLKENKPSICPDAENGMLYMKIKLKSVSLEDKDKFASSKLEKGQKYNLLSKGQTDYYIVDEIVNKQLIDDIEELTNKGHKGSNLGTVTTHFNNNYCSCEFKGIDKSRDHNTFVEENGHHFYNEHHLVTKGLIQNYNKTIKDPDKIINVNEKRNLFKLCPNCHMEIHHGKKEIRKEKIKFLYEIDAEFYDNNFNELKNGKKTLDWLYELYKCN